MYYNTNMRNICKDFHISMILLIYVKTMYYTMFYEMCLESL